MLSLGQLYTDDTNDNDNATATNDNDANDDDNNTQQTNHDCIGSLACMPNEPKTRKRAYIYGKNKYPKLRIPIALEKEFKIKYWGLPK